MENETKRVSLAEIREKLVGGRSKWWRSFDQIAETPVFKKWVEDEFPERASLLQLDRRKFLQLTGASMLMASLVGCRRLDKDEIVPFVKMPEDQVLGKPEYYATSFVHGGYGVGVLAESRQGRPTKLEGNPIHPASRGKSSAIAQASIYGLYDPFRSKDIKRGRATGTLRDFVSAADWMLHDPRNTGGTRIAIVTETITSPSTAAQIKRFMERWPETRWYSYEPCNRDHVFEGAKIAFGEPLNPVYHFERADVVLSLDADFLFSMEGAVRYAADFATRRRVEGMDASQMSRLYMVESAPTTTGATADHRLSVKASEIEAFARELCLALGVQVQQSAKSSVDPRWTSAVAADLQGAKGRCLVIAGDHQPPAVHALANAINFRLGNVGQTVTYTAVPEASNLDKHRGIAELASSMRAGQVDVLFILGGNPAYSAPGDIKFGNHLGRVQFSMHLGSHDDETSEKTKWHLPETHYLETWGDARAYDGTISLQQPLIAPLYPTYTVSEVIEKLLGGTRTAKEILKDFYTKPTADNPKPLTESEWKQAIHDGMIRGSELPAKPVTLTDAIAAMPPSAVNQGMETVFLPDPTVFDGRYAGNAWLQELPKPMTSTCWDNLVLLSPKTAESLGAQNGDLVEVEIKGGKVQGGAWMNPGQAEDLVVLHHGYGRESGAPFATYDGVEMRGFNANMVRTWDAPTMIGGVKLTKVGGSISVANAQEQHVMATTDGNVPLDIVRSGTAAEFEQNPNLSPDPELEKEPLRTLYKDDEFKYDGNRWAMTIDLGLCTGCGACTAACQVENNVPSVGKLQVVKGRIMHWIRVDRYYKGGPDKPSETLFQPVTCMQCENAPCEPVCPVAATTHSKDGLNQMIYNRCVGTRYCSNNCPYKVRRFNYLNFGDKKDHPTLTLLNNPDVTVRGRGVMEKCTYCVQRISVARIEAKKANRPIADGEIVTACQQACPSKAIVFGDMADRKSAVSASRNQPRNYTLLRELNTRPRTTYLARVRNTNKAIEAIEGAHGA